MTDYTFGHSMLAGLPADPVADLLFDFADSSALAVKLYEDMDDAEKRAFMRLVIDKPVKAQALMDDKARTYLEGMADKQGVSTARQIMEDME